MLLNLVLSTDHVSHPQLSDESIDGDVLHGIHLFNSITCMLNQRHDSVKLFHTTETKLSSRFSTSLIVIGWAADSEIMCLVA